MSSAGYFEHGADIGVVGFGPTVEAAFCAAAGAMFAVMVDPAQVRPTETVVVEFDEEDLEFALVAWLNRLLAEALARGMVFVRFRLVHAGAHWRGEADGESWHEGLTRGVEVKGATLTNLAVAKRDGGWEARCVVDV